MSDYMFVKQISSLISRESHPVKVKETGEYNEIGIRSHGKGIFHKKAVLGKTLGDKRVFKIIPNCIVFNIVFAWEQALAITSDAEEGFVASHRFPMYSAKSGKADLRYLRYYFLTKRGKADLELASPGGAGRNKTLGQKDFEKLKIRVPDFACQKKIADILSVWDKSIEATERLLENSKKRKKALMQQLLTGKKRLPGFGGESLKLAKLKEVTNISKGKALSSEDLIDGPYKVIAGGKTSPYSHAKFTHEDVITVSASGAYAGFVSYHEEKIWASDCSVIVGKKQVSTTDYLFHCLSYQQQRIYSLQSGGAQPHIYPKDLETLPINLPSLEEQIEISKILNTSDREIDLLSEKIDFLKNEKKALMQQLLTGKKRVKVEGEINTLLSEVAE